MATIIPPSGTFLSQGAIILDDNELAAVIHALIEERDRVKNAEGDHYGRMTIQELEELIAQLQAHQEEKGT
jgi:hypothetical protein